ncbi:MAG: hypothetical protein DWI00_01665 [Planctomycetota bacterium]|nr:MAG: hypothetical protein DWI00_01665 [Planctomycetota bacterium]
MRKFATQTLFSSEKQGGHDRQIQISITTALIFEQLTRWSSLKRRSLRNTSNAHVCSNSHGARKTQDKVNVQESQLLDSGLCVLATGFSPAKSTPIIRPVQSRHSNTDRLRF